MSSNHFIRSQQAWPLTCNTRNESSLELKDSENLSTCWKLRYSIACNLWVGCKNAPLSFMCPPNKLKSYSLYEFLHFWWLLLIFHSVGLIPSSARITTRQWSRHWTPNGASISEFLYEWHSLLIRSIEWQIRLETVVHLPPPAKETHQRNCFLFTLKIFQDEMKPVTKFLVEAERLTLIEGVILTLTLLFFGLLCCIQSMIIGED